MVLRLSCAAGLSELKCGRFRAQRRSGRGALGTGAHLMAQRGWPVIFAEELLGTLCCVARDRELAQEKAQATLFHRHPVDSRTEVDGGSTPQNRRLFDGHHDGHTHRPTQQHLEDHTPRRRATQGVGEGSFADLLLLQRVWLGVHAVCHTERHVVTNTIDDMLASGLHTEKWTVVVRFFSCLPRSIYLLVHEARFGAWPLSHRIDFQRF